MTGLHTTITQHIIRTGKARAKRSDGARDVLCLQIHGDAAVSGQVKFRFCFFGGERGGVLLKWRDARRLC